MADAVKTLQISIVIDSTKAAKEATRFLKTITSQFRNMKFPLFTALNQQILETTKLLEKMPGDTKMFSKYRAQITKLENDLDRLKAKMKKGIAAPAHPVTAGILTQQEYDAEKSYNKMLPVFKKRLKLIESTRDQELKIHAASEKSITEGAIHAEQARHNMILRESEQRAALYKQQWEKEIETDKKGMALKSAQNKMAIQSMTRSVQGFLKETRAYNKAAADVSKQMRLDPNTVKSWQLSEKSLRNLGGALTTVNKASKSTAGGLKQVNKVIRDINSDVIVKGQGKVLGVHPDELNKSVVAMKNIAGESKQAGAAIKALGIQYEGTHNRFAKLAASTINYMKFQMGWFLGAGVIFAIIGAIRSMAKASLEFAQTLKNIQAITGASSLEMMRIADAAKEIAWTTPMAATEVAEMGLQLIRAGLSATDTAAAMKVAAKVAVVSGESAKTVADTIATSMMAWRHSAEDAEMIGNVLAATLNFSRLQVEDLKTAFVYFGAVASAFNKSFAETNAILAVFSNIGFRASTIATSMARLLARIEAPTKKAKEALRGLGIEEESISSMNKFADVVERFEKSGMTAGMAMSMFEVRAGRILAAALTVGSKAFREMEKRLKESTQLTEGLNRVMEGPIAQFQRLRNILFATAIDLGDSLLPFLKLLVGALTLLAKSIAHTVHIFTQWYLLYPLLTLYIGRLIYKMELLTKVTTLFSKAMVRMAGTVATFNIATAGTASIWANLLNLFKKAPGYIKVIAIALSVLGVGTILDKLFGGPREITELEKRKKAIEQTIKEIVGSAKIDFERLDKTIERTNKGLQELVNDLKQWKLSLYETVTLPTGEVDYKAKPLTQELLKALGPIRELNDKIKEQQKEVDKLESEWDDLQKTIADPTAFDRVIQYLDVFSKKVREAFQSIADAAEEYGPKIWGVLKHLPFFRKLERISASLDEMGKDAKTAAEARAKEIEDELKVRKEAILKLQKELVAATKNVDIKNILLDIFETYTWKHTAPERLEEILKYMSNAIKEGTTSEEFLGILGTLADPFKNVLDDVSADIDKEISDLVKRLKKEYDNMDAAAKLRIANMEQDMSMKKALRELEYNDTKRILDETQQLNDLYYSMGLKSAQDFVDERSRIQVEAAQNNIANEERAHKEELDRLQANLDAQIASISFSYQQLATLRSQKTLSGGGEEKLDRDILDKETAIKNLEREADSTRHLMALEKQRWGFTLPALNAALKFLKQILNIKSDIEVLEAKKASTERQLTIEKEILDMELEALELSHQYNDTIMHRLDILDKEKELTLLNIRHEIDKLEYAQKIKDLKTDESKYLDELRRKEQAALDLYEAKALKVIDAMERFKVTAEDTGMAIQDAFEKMFFGKFKEGLDGLLDYFKTTLIRMVANALATKIYIPVHTVMFGGQGSTGGSMLNVGAGGVNVGQGGVGFNVPSNWLTKLFGGGAPTLGAQTAGGGYYVGAGAFTAKGGAAGISQGTAGAASGTGLGAFLPWLGAGLGGYMIGSQFGGYGGIGGALGGVGGYALGTSTMMAGLKLGALAGPIGIVVGALIGGLIGGMFGKKKPPRTQLGYTEEAGFTIRHEELWDPQKASEFKKSMTDLREKLITFVETIGGETSQFDKDWLSARIKVKKDTDLAKVAEEFLKAYIQEMTNVDFTQFQTGSETLLETINRIVTAVISIGEVTKLSGDDIKTFYDNLELAPKTLKQTLNELHKSLSDSIDELGDLEGVEWGNKITEIGNLIAQTRELEIQYLIYIKGLVASIGQTVEDTLIQLDIDTMNTEEKIGFANQRLFDLVKQGAEALGIPEDIINMILENYSIEDIVKFINENGIGGVIDALKAWGVDVDAIIKNLDPTAVEEWFKKFMEVFNWGWGLLTDEEKAASKEGAKAYLQAIWTVVEPLLQSGVDAQIEAIGEIKTKLADIDWTPLQRLTTSADEAAAALDNVTTSANGVKSYQSGTDYVPMTGLYKLHRGEAVIPANQNTSEGNAIVIELHGDASPFITKAVNKATGKTILMLKKNPELLYR